VRRRRLVGALVLAAVIAVAVAVAMLAGSGAEPAAAAGVVPAVADASTSAAASGEPAGTAAAVHVARAGDTMWAIAHRYRGSTPHGDYLAALLERNGGAALRVGQPVALP
jgi:Tfp pilus assembly protein FimV